MNTEQLLERVKQRLQEAYGEHLRGVVLHGSHARGEANEQSDLDVLALIDKPVTTWEDVSTACQAVYPLILETGRTIDVRPVNARDYYENDAPLYANARREGISV